MLVGIADAGSTPATSTNYGGVTAFDGVYGSTKDNWFGDLITIKVIGNDNFVIVGVEPASAALEAA